MPAKYTKAITNSEPKVKLFGREDEQVFNHEGGAVFAVTPRVQLERFLILGNEGGSYYANEKKMTTENAKNVIAMMKDKNAGPWAVGYIVGMSLSGRAPKNDPALFALALACTYGDDIVRDLAMKSIPQVARTGTHLFTFVEYVNELRGWGRGLKAGVGAWYADSPVDKLAYQLVKYRQRNGWSHADVLRLSHPVMTGVRGELAKFALGKEFNLDIPVVNAYVQLQDVTTAKQALKIIQKHPKVPFEAIPTQFLKEPAIWEALLPNMPMTAMIRNLGRMTALGLIAPLSDASKQVIAKLGDVEALHAARVHPLQAVVAQRTYARGRGDKGDLSWNPVGAVTSALEGAFYGSFETITPTGSSFLLGLDVSGSMSCSLANMPLSCAEGTALMSMVTARSEKNYEIFGFAHTFKNLGINSSMSLQEACRRTQMNNFGGTDCSLPMEYAIKNKLKVDAFVVYTDSETYTGRRQPVTALNDYRQKSGINAKLIVVGMVSNRFTIADPKDAGMLDVVGFDTATPAVISDFSRKDV